MPSLKDLRTRISSVKSTKRITSAMKMVAAAKLRRAQDQAIAARPYAERMERMLGSLAGGTSGEGGPKLLAGTGNDNVHLLVVMTTDRGLCGGFNGSIMRGVRKMIRDLEADSKTVKLFGVGRKGNAIMRRAPKDETISAVAVLLCRMPVTARPVQKAENRLRVAFAITRRIADPKALVTPVRTMRMPHKSRATPPAISIRVSKLDYLSVRRWPDMVD